MPQYDRTRSVACFVFGVGLAAVPLGIAACLALTGLQAAVALPDPAAFLLFATLYTSGLVAVGLWFVVLDRRSQTSEDRTRRRACLHCGYSVRHLTAPTARCPECGRRFKRP